MTDQRNVPNPRRVAAGKRNQAKRQGLTAEGREKLRQNALVSEPWRQSTGPRTPEGKARSAQNGKVRQRGAVSTRCLPSRNPCHFSRLIL